MCAFVIGLCQWIRENIYSFLVTFISVLASGYISYLISKYYFEKSNEANNLENLKLSVIYPLIALLKSRCTLENYSRLISLEKEYSIKYMPANIRACLSNFCSIYKELVYYDENDTNAKILFKYFERSINEQGIKWEPSPVTINGVIVDYEPPEGYFELEDDISKVLKRFDYHIEAVECQEKLELIFMAHVKRFCLGKKPVFFKDTCLSKIIKEDVLTAQSKKLFEKYEYCKNELLNIPLIKEEIQAMNN